jgi:hypothetical protein
MNIEYRCVYLYWVGKEYTLISILRRLIYLHSTNEVIVEEEVEPTILISECSSIKIKKVVKPKKIKKTIVIDA